jgi:hypothetical protein
MSAQERERGQPSNRRVIIHSRATSEQIQVERIAYFTEKIGLTPEEAQVFWPIYNEMDKKRTALFEEKASILQMFTKGTSNLNDKQINEQLNRLAAINQQEGALHGEYDAKFRKALSAQKVMNLYVAEIGFRNYLLQTMRNRRESNER